MEKIMPRTDDLAEDRTPGTTDGERSVPAVTLTGVTKSFPGVRALSDVDFDCRPGEVHALVGENGSGKSTLIKIASGVLGADEGTVLIGGEELGRRRCAAGPAPGAHHRLPRHFTGSRAERGRQHHPQLQRRRRVAAARPGPDARPVQPTVQAHGPGLRSRPGRPPVARSGESDGPPPPRADARRAHRRARHASGGTAQRPHQAGPRRGHRHRVREPPTGRGQAPRRPCYGAARRRHPGYARFAGLERRRDRRAHGRRADRTRVPHAYTAVFVARPAGCPRALRSRVRAGVDQRACGRDRRCRRGRGQRPASAAARHHRHRPDRRIEQRR